VITVRKAINLAKHQMRQSRGAGRVRTLSDLAEWSEFSDQGAEPTPELAAQFADECRRLLHCLKDETLRSVAVWRLEGYTNEEIAERLDCVPQTVERKLRTIRKIWSAELPP
jgi:DNA-directed RNA polymerase specialized sigma24 family protein